MALTKVKTAGIDALAVTQSKLATDAVGLDQLAAGTDGKIITWDASGDPVAVGPGDDGQVLTSTGAGSPPAFEDAAAGDSISEGNTKAEVVDTGSDGHFKVETEGSERFRIDSSGNVGIGTTNPMATAGYMGLELNGTTGGVIVFSDDDVNKWEVWASDDELGFFSRAASSPEYRLKCKKTGNVEITNGDLVLANGHGIDFSAAETATATSGEQILDAYEQGTWTITYPNGTITAAHSVGKYIKVGNLCTAWMGFEISSVSSDTYPSFSLPFAQKLTGTNSDARATGSIMMHKVDWLSGQIQATSYIGAEASVVSIFMTRDNLGWQQLENDEISANDWFYITITYQTA